MVKFLLMPFILIAIGCSQNSNVNKTESADAAEVSVVNENATVDNETSKAELVKFTYKALGCGFACPIFSLTINKDGIIDYQGERFVAIEGSKQSKLTPSQLQHLKGLLAGSQAVLKQTKVVPGSEYCKVPRTDQQTLLIKLETTEDVKSVRYYTGCMQAPDSVTQLFAELYDLLNLDYWIKNQADY